MKITHKCPGPVLALTTFLATAEPFFGDHPQKVRKWSLTAGGHLIQVVFYTG